MENTQEILKACRVGDVELLKSVLNAHPDAINNTDVKLGWSGLYCSVMCGHLEITKFMLQNHALVNLQNRMGETALHQAVSCKNLKMVQLLLKHHADPNIQQSDGETPLHLAVLKSHSKMVHTLLEHNADPNIPNLVYGKTPVHYASESEDPKILEELCQYSPDFSIKDKLGNPPLPLPLDPASSRTELKSLQRLSPEPLDFACMTQQLSPSYTRCNSDMSLLTDYRAFDTRIRQIEVMHKKIRETVRTSVDPLKRLDHSAGSLIELESERTAESKPMPTEVHPELFRWLKSLRLLEEYELLVNAGYDDVSQLIKQMQMGMPLTERSLIKIGMKKAGHRRRLLAAIERISSKEEGSYLLNQLQCCLAIPNSLWVRNMDTLEAWLNELNLGGVEAVMREAGFEEVEDIVGLVNTQWAVDETLLMDIGIEKPGYRHRILARLREYNHDKNHELVIEKNSNNSACTLCTVM